MMKETVTIFWFRRDLRLEDNAGLYHALRSGMPVIPLFIFDRHILDQLEDPADARVSFIHQALEELQRTLVSLGSSLEVVHGYPVEVFRHLLSEYRIGKVVTNHDYEPYARERDQAVADLLRENGVGMETWKDQVIFEKSEVVKDDGRPYTVFTPYSRRWKALFQQVAPAPYKTRPLFSGFCQRPAGTVPALSAIGFRPSALVFPLKEVSAEIIKKYKERRDIPAIADGTTHIGVHLRFGTVSIRKLVGLASGWSETWLNELIWREFFQMILWHFPAVGRGGAFKPAYDRIRWRNNEEEFDRWCRGMTGYPIVDAGMRELEQTGFMHNRIRMVTASFLAKHLLIDWRWGEAWFAGKLLDYDLAANNGNWQWAAGSGCDAAPWFRIFNPYLQTKKFDPEMAYIRRWVPEWESPDYPAPLVVHEVARARALEVYGKALKEGREG